MAPVWVSSIASAEPSGGGVRVGGGGLVHEARQAEVRHAHGAIVRDEHVVGLEVAVHDALRVGGGEPAAGVQEPPEHLAPVAGPRGEPLPERHAVDELHGDEHLAAERARVVYGDDVGVAQAGERLGLAQEARLRGRAEVLAHQLDGDLAVELPIVGGVDDGRAAAPYGLEQHVAVADRH